MLLAKVIDDLDGLRPVTTEMVEELFEVDFLYLQLLYKELNGENDDRITAICPKCGESSVVNIPGLYQDMSLYQQKEGGQETE
jgi:hypothetical protein